MNIPAGYAQVNYIFTGSALPRGAQLTFGVSLLPAPDNQDAAFIAAALHAAFANNLISLLPSTASLSATRVKFGPNETGPFAVHSDPEVGTWATSPDSPQVAVLIAKQTALGGRVNRGRWFFPIPGEVATNAGGLLASATVEGFNDLLELWITAVNGTGGVGDLVLLHNDPEVAPTVITSMVAQETLATQRRRLRKVGGRRRIL